MLKAFDAKLKYVVDENVAAFRKNCSIEIFNKNKYRSLSE